MRRHTKKIVARALNVVTHYPGDRGSAVQAGFVVYVGPLGGREALRRAITLATGRELAAGFYELRRIDG